MLEGTPVFLTASLNGTTLVAATDSSDGRLMTGSAGLLSGSAARTQYDDFSLVVPRPATAVTGDDFDDCTSSTDLGPNWTVTGGWYCRDRKARGESVPGTAFFETAVPSEVTVRARVQLTGVLRVRGSGVVTLEAEVDGLLVLAATDSSASRLVAGRGGLLGGTAARTQFDDFNVFSP